MQVIRNLVVVSTLLAFVWTAPIALAAGGGGGGSAEVGGSGGSGGRSSRSPAAVAKRHYQAGIRHKEKAWKLEEKAAREEDPEDRAELLEKASKAYSKALAAQNAAVKANPKDHAAYNELGYALRKNGQYAEAIEAYDRALAIDSTYFPAIEYRGEAYLATGQLEKAKRAYMVLFRNERPLADQLLDAMEAWLVKQPPDQVEAFAAWVEERKALAAAGDDLSQNNTRTW
jgi:tetratricopeptide (TPR) repeat protein